MNGLEKFEYELPVITPERALQAKRNWNIDLGAMDASNLELILNFMEHGASEAIMNRLLAIQRQQANENQGEEGLSTDENALLEG